MVIGTPPIQTFFPIEVVGPEQLRYFLRVISNMSQHRYLPVAHLATRWA